MKKIALVGGSPSSENLAPFADESWQIWVHGNQFDRHVNHRVNRIFEIHDDLSQHPPEYPAWLANKQIPMIVGRYFPLTAPHISVFPFTKANELMGQHLTSTPAYMMALAILEGATDIGIYGVDMAVDSHEYFHQRPTMYAWIGYAKALGINVTIPKESGLFVDDYIEGTGGTLSELAIAPFTEQQFMEMANLHRQKIDAMEQQRHELLIKINAHSGSQQTYERLAKVARAIEAGIAVNTLTETARLL
jgi:hypothetical protein